MGVEFTATDLINHFGELKMSITVTEKEHWKERIARKIQRRIDSLISTKQPSYLEEVDRKSREQAIELLGISECRIRTKELETKVEQLQAELKNIEMMEFAIVTGCSSEQAASSYRYSRNVDQSLRRATAIAKRKVMSRDKLGQTILSLQDEQEELLDTVWLSTSSKQIRELWKSVTALVKDNPTCLQQAALNTEPIEGSE